MLDTLDRAALATLLEMVGDDPAFVDELVDAYLADAPAQLAAMRSAASKGAAEELIRPAHTMKGSSLNLGAARVSAYARAIEERARSGTVDGVDRLLDELEVAYASLVSELASARERRWTGG